MPADSFEVVTLNSTWLMSSKVELSENGKRLVWFRPFEQGRCCTTDDRVLLGKFLALASPAATDADFLDFARVAGPLLICHEHDLPVTHIGEKALPFVKEELLLTHRAGACFQGWRTWWEEIEIWRKLARQAEAMSTIANCVHQKRRPPADRLKLIDELMPTAGNPGQRSLVDEPDELHPRAVQLAIQRWLDWSDIGVSFEFQTFNEARVVRNRTAATRAALRIGASSLFGTLALSLAMSASNAQSFAVCAACGRSFLPHRHRQEGTNAWCGDEKCDAEKKRREAILRRQRDKAAKQGV